MLSGGREEHRGQEGSMKVVRRHRMHGPLADCRLMGIQHIIVTQNMQILNILLHESNSVLKPIKKNKNVALRYTIDVLIETEFQIRPALIPSLVGSAVTELCVTTLTSFTTGTSLWPSSGTCANYMGWATVMQFHMASCYSYFPITLTHSVIYFHSFISICIYVSHFIFFVE